jgi:hypothetical protein
MREYAGRRPSDERYHLWYYVPREMLDKLAHRVELLAARRTAHDHDASPIQSDRRRG